MRRLSNFILYTVIAGGGSISLIRPFSFEVWYPAMILLMLVSIGLIVASIVLSVTAEDSAEEPRSSKRQYVSQLVDSTSAYYYAVGVFVFSFLLLYVDWSRISVF